MTNFTTRMMMAAATLVVAAGSASAQGLTAEIPFPFRAAGTVMAAGKYELRTTQNYGHPVYRIWNVTEHRAILVLASGSETPAKAWVAAGKPVLTFECGTGRCSLSGIWDGSSLPASTFPRGHLGRDEAARTEIVVMHKAKGD